MTGIVVEYNSLRGFGLIEPLIGKPKTTPLVFFHVSAILGYRRGAEGGIPTGAEVEFDLVRGRFSRPQAANVKLRILNGSVLRGADGDKVI